MRRSGVGRGASRGSASLLVAALLAAAAGPSQALGREVTYGEVMRQHPDQVTWVQTCGAWRSGAQDGVYRVVHATLHAQSLLYVQWVTVDGEGRHRPLHTLSVPELNNDHAEISLDRLRCVATPHGIAVRAVAEFGHDGTTGTVEVSVRHRPGHHRFVRTPK